MFYCFIFALKVLLACSTITIKTYRSTSDKYSNFSHSTEYSFALNEPGGPNCPFSGAWLAGSHLLMRTKFVLTDDLIEKATFKIFRHSNVRFQTTDHSIFFVNHMSQYEHCIRRSGFSNETIEENCRLHAEGAMMGECDQLVGRMNNMTSYSNSIMNNTLVVMPYYDGKWRGHSIVSSEVKVMRGLATICSTLKHFRRVLVGTIIGLPSANDNSLLNVVSIFIFPCVALS
jgi:hypothetical protein